MPLLDDLKTYLIAQSVGIVGSVTAGVVPPLSPAGIYVGQMPDVVNAGLVLFEYAGAAPDFVLDDPTVHVEHPRFQLLVRHPTFATGRALMETAYNKLSRIVNQTLGSTKYLRVASLQPPFQLDPPQDAQGRWEWRCNFQASKALG